MKKNISKKNMALAMEVYEKDWADSVNGAIDYYGGEYDEIGDRDELIQEYIDEYKEEFLKYVQENASDFRRARGISDEDYKREIDMTIWQFIIQAEPEGSIRDRAVEEDILQIYTDEDEEEDVAED